MRLDYYVKRTKFGYEVWRNKTQVGVGVGISMLQFLKIKHPTTRVEKQLAKRGIYLLQK